MTSPKIQFREVEPAEVYLRQVDSLRSKLCRAREALEEVRKEELQYGNICQETTMPLVEQALSSSGPCRHEEENKRLRNDNKRLTSLYHGQELAELYELEAENKRLKEAVEWTSNPGAVDKEGDSLGWWIWENLESGESPRMILTKFLAELRRRAFTTKEG